MEQIYSPGAGHLPEDDRLPGREHIIDSWRTMLAGLSAKGRPRARDLVLTGHRGVGKTVTMKACLNACEKAGYARLEFQATPDTTLAAALASAAEAYAANTADTWTKAARLLSRLSGSIGLGPVSLEVANAPDSAPAGDRAADPYNASAIARAVADLARAEQRRNDGRGGVVIAIDELQAAAPADIRTIGAILNHLNNFASDAPVAFIAAGLPNTSKEMIGPLNKQEPKPRISNPSRLFVFEELSAHLKPTDTERALREPAQEHGCDWTPEAVAVVTAETGGYPAHLQALAAATWTRAAGPLVEANDVETAVPDARAEIARMYFDDRWAVLGPVQRAYITALALAGGEAQSGKIAAMLGRKTTGLSETRESLIDKGEIFAPRDGWVALAQPMIATYAPFRYREVDIDAHNLPTLVDMADARDKYVDRRTSADAALTDDQVRSLILQRAAIQRDADQAVDASQTPPAEPPEDGPAAPRQP